MQRLVAFIAFSLSYCHTTARGCPALDAGALVARRLSSMKPGSEARPVSQCPCRSISCRITKHSHTSLCARQSHRSEGVEQGRWGAVCTARAAFCIVVQLVHLRVAHRKASPNIARAIDCELRHCRLLRLVILEPNDDVRTVGSVVLLAMLLQVAHKLAAEPRLDTSHRQRLICRHSSSTDGLPATVRPLDADADRHPPDPVLLASVGGGSAVTDDCLRADG
eukprot:2727092-Prymnesium_polylepis.1